MRLPAELEDHFPFELAKRGLTLLAKISAMASPPWLDERVGIDVDQVELLGECFPTVDLPEPIKPTSARLSNLL